MAAEPTFTFYTYSTGCKDDETRWHDDGINGVYFLDINDARRAAVEVHAEMTSDPDTDPVTIHLEKIKTVPITSQSVLSLLNNDLASFIESYKIIESFVIGHKVPEHQIG